MSLRAQRLQEFLKAELSQIIQQELKDPRIGFVSITDVEATEDLRHARVFVSVLGDDQAKEQTMAGLHSAQGFIRAEVAKRMRTRYTPEIAFKLDQSIERGTRVVTLLRDVTKGSHGSTPGPADRGDTPDES
ncbi:MAG TPA: 30S ribosome-binding factor RbfA [bacterium]|jgi:ribosome-binding factor A